MQTSSEIKILRSQIRTWRQAGLRIAFVPTMGNLHAGHFSLVEKAKQLADKVVVSIFVNPMQFGANEDLANYPRTLSEDKNGLIEHGTDFLFTPNVQTIYPNGLEAQTYVDVPQVSSGYCGNSRPAHFRGVATIVNKLFNLVQPDMACFGEKDFQQLQVIKTMVNDLSIPVEVIGVPTQREVNGLAMSSRNGYLSDEQKQQASLLFATLSEAAKQIKHTSLTFDAIEQIEQRAKQTLTDAGFTVDYFSIADQHTLAPANDSHQQLVILTAAKLGNVRLIDNLTLTRD